jgi:hypothetical protein
MPAVGVFQNDTTTGRAVRCDLVRVAPPEADVVSLKRKISRGRE